MTSVIIMLAGSSSGSVSGGAAMHGTLLAMGSSFWCKRAEGVTRGLRRHARAVSVKCPCAASSDGSSGMCRGTRSCPGATEGKTIAITCAGCSLSESAARSRAERLFGVNERLLPCRAKEGTVSRRRTTSCVLRSALAISTAFFDAHKYSLQRELFNMFDNDHALGARTRTYALTNHFQTRSESTYQCCTSRNRSDSVVSAPNVMPLTRSLVP